MVEDRFDDAFLDHGRLAAEADDVRDTTGVSHQPAGLAEIEPGEDVAREQRPGHPFKFATDHLLAAELGIERFHTLAIETYLGDRFLSGLRVNGVPTHRV